MFTYIFHILELSGIISFSQKLSGNTQDLPEFGKFPSKGEHWAACSKRPIEQKMLHLEYKTKYATSM